MSAPRLNLLVLRSDDPVSLASFYSRFGLEFAMERHGLGPEHQVCVLGETVLEIYPSTPENPVAISVRLGFRVQNIERIVGALEPPRIVKALHLTPEGRSCTVKDPEGRKIDLLETGPGLQAATPPSHTA